MSMQSGQNLRIELREKFIRSVESITIALPVVAVEYIQNLNRLFPDLYQQLMQFG